jgi:hypothetical protein
MKIKVFVTIALFTAVFLAVSIFLVGYLNSPSFPYIFFLFSLFWSISLAFTLKHNFSKGETVTIIIMTLLLATSMTFFGNNVKMYFDKSQAEGDSQLQIANITSTNNYYTSYIEYLNTAIKQSENNSLALLNRINTLNTLILQKQTPQPPQIIIQQVPTVVQNQTQQQPISRREENDD